MAVVHGATISFLAHLLPSCIYTKDCTWARPTELFIPAGDSVSLVSFFFSFFFVSHGRRGIPLFSFSFSPSTFRAFSFFFFFFAQLRTIRPSFLSRKYSAKFPMRNHPFDSSPAGDRISIRRSCFSLFATEFGNCQGRTLFRVAGKFENTRARVSTECAVAQKFFFFFFLFRFLSQSRDTCSLVEWWEISLPCVFDTEDIFTVEYFYSPAILSFAFVNLSLGKFERYSQRPWKLYYIMWKWCSKFKISSFLHVHFVYVSANKRDKQIPICRLENVLPAREIL